MNERMTRRPDEAALRDEALEAQRFRDITGAAAVTLEGCAPHGHINCTACADAAVVADLRARLAAAEQESDGWKRAYQRALEQAQEHIDALAAVTAKRDLEIAPKNEGLTRIAEHEEDHRLTVGQTALGHLEDLVRNR